MQGRLLPPQDGKFQSFPRERWREEFSSSVEAGLDAIEWIYDLHGAAVNPISTDEGIGEIKALTQRFGVVVVSMCADYFMDRPFVRATPADAAELAGHLCWLLTRCNLAGIRRVVLPFVDESRIENADQEERVVSLLRGVLTCAEKASVEVHLETSLGPERFAQLLAKLPHPMLRVNYDSGNSASLGYDVRHELAAYGSRIGSVHIKDRVRNGSTVPLGAGQTDFTALFSRLSDMSYSGDYVLQVARGLPGEEIAWARQNRAFVRQHVERSTQIICGAPQ